MGEWKREETDWPARARGVLGRGGVWGEPRGSSPSSGRTSRIPRTAAPTTSLQLPSVAWTCMRRSGSAPLCRGGECWSAVRGQAWVGQGDDLVRAEAGDGRNPSAAR